MSLKIRQNKWDKLDKELRKKLHKLTMRGWSGMTCKIREISTSSIDHKVFVLFEDETPVAWAIAAEDDLFDEYDVMVYTRRDRRRLGYGKKLIRKAEKWVASRDKDMRFFVEPENRSFWTKTRGEQEVELMLGGE